MGTVHESIPGIRLTQARNNLVITVQSNPVTLLALSNARNRRNKTWSTCKATGVGGGGGETEDVSHQHQHFNL